MLDKLCIGRRCFAPGNFQHRAPLMGGGSRNTGGSTPCCMNNAYHGCPRPLPEFEKAKADQRKLDGWRNA